jgi:multidrug efflux pump subunit AcrB
MVWGNKDYSMRVWLDPEKLNSYGLAPIDISNAIQSRILKLLRKIRGKQQRGYGVCYAL